jgi:hypothetical protein
MNDTQMTEQAKVYIDALRRLVRSGVNAAHDLEQSPLIELKPVVNATEPQASAVARADAFVALLIKVVGERLLGRDRTKGELLFGLGEYAGMPTSERYSRVAKLHDPKGGSWDKFRKEPLTDFLVTVLTALHREDKRRAADEASRSHESETTQPRRNRRTPQTGGDFSLKHYEVLYNLPQIPGAERESLEMREVQASRDGVTKWQIASQYWGKSPGEGPAITLFGPGQLEIVRDQELHQAPHPGRVYITRVTFPQALDMGETIRFGLMKRQPVEFTDLVRDGWRDQRDITPVIPVDHALIGVRFPEGRRPQTVWHFEDVPDYLSPGAPDETNSLQPDASGYVSFSWDDLLVGHAYGVAWRW